MKIKEIKKLIFRKMFFIWKVLLDSKRRSSTIDKNRVLIADCEKIGNYIFKTPMIKELSKAGYQVSVLGSSVTESLIKGNKDVYEFIDSKCYRKKSSDIFKKVYLALKLRKQFKVYIEMTGSIYLRELLFMRLLRPEKIIGVPRKHNQKLNLISEVIINQGHHIDNALEVLKLLNLNGERKYHINLSGNEKYSNFKSDDLIVLYNGTASTKSRSLSSQEENKIKKFLQEKKGVKFIKIEREHSLLDLASLIEISDVVISVDTGITHMASAFNKPIIINKYPNITAPISERVFLSDFTKSHLNSIINNFLNSKHIFNH